jgi:zinc protease
VLDQRALWYAATPLDGVGNTQLRAAMIISLTKAADSLTDDDVKQAIIRLTRQATLARDSVAGPAMIIGQNLAIGWELDDIETWPQWIAKVTKKEVVDAIKNLLLCSPSPTCQPPITAMVEVDRTGDQP